MAQGWIWRLAAAALMTGCAGMDSNAGSVRASLDPPVPLRRCAPATTDEMRRAGAADRAMWDGVAGLRCELSPGLRLFLVSDDSVSWPAVQIGDMAPSVLIDPFAERSWLPETRRVSIALGDGQLVVARGSGAGRTPVAAYFSGFADRVDGDGSVDVLVVLRLRPEPCLLGVMTDQAAARRLSTDPGSVCLPPVGSR